MKQNQLTDSAKLSGWFLSIGLLAILGTAILTARLIWEHTALSWNNGPQMVGFTLAHGIGFVLYFFPLLLAGWLMIALGYLGWCFWKTRRIAPASLQAVSSAIALLILLSLPGGFWVRLFIDRFTNGPYASEFFTYSAAIGDFATVKAFLTKGIQVDVRDREEKTALHCAAVAGRLEIVMYLVSKGADVNAISLWGDSPLEVATSEGYEETARFLAAHGAKRIKGSDEQRDKAAATIVRKDIDKMESRHPELTIPRGKP